MAKDKIKQSSIFFGLGCFTLIFTVIISGAALVYIFEGVSTYTPQQNAEAAQLLSMCSAFLILVNAAFFGLWYVKKRKEDMPS